MRLLEAL
ncbi:hypothetical protein Nmel_014414 [Mimus melanotis]